VYLQALAQITDSGSDFVEVTVTDESGATGVDVTLLSTSGSAAYLSGPLPGTPTSSPGVWTFTRGLINSGSGQALFAATKTGHESDTDTVTIEEQGRDTVPLQLRARVLSASTSQVVVRVAAADAYPGGNITLAYVHQNTGGVSPGTPQTLTGGSVTSDLDTTAYVDYTILLGTTTGRVVFTGSAANRLTDSDAVDVPPADRRNGISEVLSATPAYEGGTANLTVHFDPDTWTGTAAARYSVAGAAWVTFDVDTDKVGRFSFPQSTTSILNLEIQGSTAGSVWGTVHPMEVDRYDAPPIILSGVAVFVEDTGVGANDEYTVTIQGSSMLGKSADVAFYRSGVLRSTQTFIVAADNADSLEWTDAGAGDGVTNQHYVVVQLFDAGTGINHGAPIPSRTINSIV
jgi:hypothetical protein